MPQYEFEDADSCIGISIDGVLSAYPKNSINISVIGDSICVKNAHTGSTLFTAHYTEVTNPAESSAEQLFESLLWVYELSGGGVGVTPLGVLFVKHEYSNIDTASFRVDTQVKGFANNEWITDFYNSGGTLVINPNALAFYTTLDPDTTTPLLSSVADEGGGQNTTASVARINSNGDFYWIRLDIQPFSKNPAAIDVSTTMMASNIGTMPDTLGISIDNGAYDEVTATAHVFTPTLSQGTHTVRVSAKGGSVAAFGTVYVEIKIVVP